MQNFAEFIGPAINILILVILLCGLWTGYKKGLIMGILSIVVLIVSIYGANLLSNTFSYDVVPALKPFAGGFVENTLNGEGGAAEIMGWDNKEEYSLEDLLAQHEDETEDLAAACFEKMGIEASTAKVMAESAMAYSEAEDKNFTDSLIHELCVRISYAGCFIIAFVLIAIVLTVVINLPNLSYKIPHMDLVNDIAGTVLGLLTAGTYCAVLVWALKFMGLIIGPETLEETVLGGFFLKRDFLGAILGI